MPFMEGDPMYDAYVAGLGGEMSDATASRIADDVLAAPPAARPDDGERGFGERFFRPPADGLPRSSANGPAAGYGGTARR